MICKTLLISLLFGYLIPNIFTANILPKETILTGVDNGKVHVNDKFLKQQTCNQNNQTYCENAPDYPTEEIRQLLAKSNINLAASNVDINLNDDALDIDLTKRTRRNSQISWPLCVSQTRQIELKKGETEAGEWLFIAPNQMVMIDECINPDQPCSHTLQPLQTKCEQKYVLRKLYALDGKEGKNEIRQVKFKLPLGCACMVYNASGSSLSGRSRRHYVQHDDNERNKRNAESDHIKIGSSIQSPALTSRIDSNDIKCTEQIGSTLCTKVENYPKNIITNLRKKRGLDTVPSIGENVSLSTHNEKDKVPMCNVKTRIVFPQAAKTLNNEMKMVVQDEEGGFVQGILIEECASSGSSCNFESYFPFGYVSKCQQMHLHRKLEMVDKSGVSKPDIVSIPSWCSCLVTLVNLG